MVFLSNALLTEKHSQIIEDFLLLLDSFLSYLKTCHSVFGIQLFFLSANFFFSVWFIQLFFLSSICNFSSLLAFHLSFAFEKVGILFCQFPSLLSSFFIYPLAVSEGCIFVE